MAPNNTGRLRQFPLPDVGEGLTEAEILAWKVAPGDTVAVNQILVEIETAKAAVELPSPWAGQVHELLAEPGVTINVGTPIISIDTEPGAGSIASSSSPTAENADGATEQSADDERGSKIGEVASDGRIATLVGYIPAAGSSARRPRKGTAAGPPAPTAAAQLAAGGDRSSASEQADIAAAHAQPGHRLASAVGASSRGPAGSEGGVPQGSGSPGAGSADPRRAAPLAAPPVRKFAKDLGVDLALVASSREDGVITRADVQAAADSDQSTTDSSMADESFAGQSARDQRQPAARRSGGETRVPIKGVRKLTAQAMVSSAFTAPHVTEFLTVDVTAMMQLREKLKASKDFAGVKITALTFAARAVCIAAKRTPEVNSVWDEAADEIVFKDYVHLGIAAATPRGLVVPNIRDADQMSMLELANALSELTDVARQGKTPPAAMSGGTITITNVGVLGVDTGTPIINPGESAILALGSIKDMPWVVDGQLAVRKVCQLALAFDHRVIDGQQGSEFLADVGAILADPGMAMVF